MDDNSKPNWEAMSIDDLFALRERVQTLLRERLTTELAELDRRLQALVPASAAFASSKRLRRRIKAAGA